MIWEAFLRVHRLQGNGATDDDGAVLTFFVVQVCNPLQQSKLDIEMELG